MNHARDDLLRGFDRIYEAQTLAGYEAGNRRISRRHGRLEARHLGGFLCQQFAFAAMPLVGGEQGVFQVAPSRSGGADVVLSARGLWLPNAAVLGLPSPPVAAMHDPGAPLTLPVFLDAISSGLAR